MSSAFLSAAENQATNGRLRRNRPGLRRHEERQPKCFEASDTEVRRLALAY